MRFFFRTILAYLMYQRVGRKMAGHNIAAWNAGSITHAPARQGRAPSKVSFQVLAAWIYVSPAS